MSLAKARALFGAVALAITAHDIARNKGKIHTVRQKRIQTIEIGCFVLGITGLIGSDSIQQLNGNLLNLLIGITDTSWQLSTTQPESAVNDNSSTRKPL